MKLNILQKFVAYVMFFSFIPLVVVGVASYTTSSNLLRDESENYTQQVVRTELDYLQLLQSQIDGLITNLSGSDDVRDSIDAANSGETTTYGILSTQAQMGYVLNSYTSIDGLVSIDIFTRSGVHFSVGDTLATQNTRNDVYQSIYSRALGADSGVVWLGAEDNVNIDSGYDKVVTAARILSEFDRESREQVPAALLIVNYDIETLADHFQDADLSGDSYLVVIDGAGRYIYHPDSTKIGQPIEPSLRDIFTDESGTRTVKLDNESVQVSYARSGQSQWVVASLVPVSTFSSLTSPIRDTTFFVLLASFAVVILAAIFYSRDIVTPIRQITERYATASASAASGAIPQPLDQNRTDEIGELIAAFNRSIESQLEREKLIADLQVATLLAQESSRLKSEFLATVSHELRTPLNSITGYTGILLDGIGGQIDDEAHTMLERVKKSSGQLLALINDVLDLSKIESGHVELNNRAISASGVVTDVIQQMNVLAASKDLELHLHVDPTFPNPVFADSERLTQIATNLISNAIKFTDKGTVDVYLKHENNHIIFSVVDTGVGIPREAQGYIFEEFRQVDSSSKRRYGGTGLGLAIVRKLVTAMDGTVRVESEVGKGTTFTVEIPLAPTPTAIIEKAV